MEAIFTNSKYRALFVIGFFICQQAVGQNCTVNAGTPQQLCNVVRFDLSGKQGGQVSSSPGIVWTQVGGSPSLTITSPNALNTSVTNVVPGVFVFRLSIQCADGVTNFNDVTVTILPPPTLALAGPDQQVCTNGGVTLAGNAPSGTETGQWTILSEGGSLTNATSPAAVFNPPGKGVYQLAWQTGNGSCSSKDTVVINVIGGTQPVSAGSDQTKSCSGSFTNLNGSDPGLAPQAGLWTFVSGPSIPIIQDPTSPGSGVSGLVPGTYVFRWSVSGPCFSGSDEVAVTVSDIKNSPNSGGNKTQTFCQADNVTQVLLNAAPLASPDETGNWTQTAGPAATIVSANTPTTRVNGLNGSSQYSFVWTVSNPGGCSASATHTLVFVPDLHLISNPPNQVLPCRQFNSSINIVYPYGGITTSSGLTRKGTLVNSPLATPSNVLIQRSGPIGNDVWTITGMDTAGLYTFLFEYRDACAAVFRTVSILVSDTAAISNAGSDIVLPCNVFTTSLVAADVPPNQGTGQWSQVSGPPANIQTPNASNTPVTVTIDGVYVFRWTIANGAGCANGTDEVQVIKSDNVIDTIHAGPDTSFCSGVSYAMRALVPGATQTGTWSNFPGNVTVSDIHDPHAIVSGIQPNQTIDFAWTVSNACDTKTDTVTISATENFAIQADAGPDKCLAAGTATVQLNGNDPGSGIPFWTSLDGAPLNGTQQQNPVATIPSNGTYRFVYNISSSGCGINTDTVVVTVAFATSVANAGSNQAVCVAAVPAAITLSATPPLIGTGTWTQTSGSGGPQIVNPDQAQTAVNNLQAGTYRFAYTITNGACASTSDTMVAAISLQPAAVSAGPDQDLCDITTGTNVPLNATPTANGLGLWTVVSGPGGNAPIFSDNNSPTSTVRNLQNGTYVLRWSTVSGAGCPVFSDEVSLSVSARASASGTSTGACGVTTVTLTGNLNTDGDWTQVSGPNTATLTNDNPNSFSAIASGMITGAYVFRYTLPAEGSCASTQANVTVTIFASPTVANAGADIELCEGVSSVTLSGNTPTSGTGSWARVSGPNTPTESGNNTPVLDLSGLVPGVYEYQYTISNGNCPASTDNVSIIVANAAAAGADQRLCAAASTTLAANVPVFYSGEWTQRSGPGTAGFLNAASPTSGVQNLVTGVYVFRWTIHSPILCGANFDEVTVVIDPPLAITGLAGPDQSVCEGGGNLTIGSGSGPVGTTYSWQPATLLSDATALQTTFTGTGAGVYNYTLVGTRGSCQATDPVSITITQVPVQPVLNAPANICENATTTVTVASVQAGVTYQWSGGLGTGSSKVVGPGTYTVTPAFDAGGCAGPPASITIIGDQLPTTAVAGVDQAICQNITTATLTGNLSPTGTPQWSLISGPNTPAVSPGPANRVVDISGLVAGTYTYEFSITNGACPASTDQVVVRKEVIATAGSDQRLCGANTVALTGNTPVIYPGVWTQVSKPLGAPDATIVSPNSAGTTVNGLTPGAGLSGTYVFRWTIQSGGACLPNFDEVTIIIDAPVTTPDAGTNTTQCEGDATVINVGSAAVPGVVYSWSPATNLSDPAASQTSFTGTAPGRYEYVLTASNGSCSVSDNVVVTINAIPATPILSAPAAACANGTATVTITNAEDGTDYTWRQGSTIVNNGAMVDLGPGTYTVTPVSVAGCTGQTATVTLGVNNPPVAAFTATPTACVVQYLATPIGAGSSYQFLFNGDALPGTANGIGPHPVVYNSSGLKRAYLRVTDANGCSDTTSVLSAVVCVGGNLPLRLLSFDGSWNGTYPALDWKADNSVNMSHFEIERSTDGIQFQKVGEQPIRNGSLVEQYQYTDPSASITTPAYYYRLKIVENTGVVTYSRIIKLASKPMLVVSVGPNPFADHFIVSIQSVGREKAKLSVMAANGALINTREVVVQRGSNQLTINNLPLLAGGVYLLRVEVGEAVQTFKLVRMQ